MEKFKTILNKLLILFLLASTLQVDSVGVVLEDSETLGLTIEDSGDLEEFDYFDLDDSESLNVSDFHLVCYEILKNNISTKDKQHKITLIDTEFIPPKVNSSSLNSKNISQNRHCSKYGFIFMNYTI